MMLMIMDITIGMVILMITALILVWLFCPQQLMTIVLMITTKNNDKNHDDDSLDDNLRS